MEQYELKPPLKFMKKAEFPRNKMKKLTKIANINLKTNGKY
jgi:hypothetical protein